MSKRILVFTDSHIECGVGVNMAALLEELLHRGYSAIAPSATKTPPISAVSTPPASNIIGSHALRTKTSPLSSMITKRLTASSEGRAPI